MSNERSLAELATYQERSGEQQSRDAEARRQTLVRLVAHAHRQRIGTVALVETTSSLGLDDELDQLVLGDTERHRRLRRRIEAARRLVRILQPDQTVE